MWCLLTSVDGWYSTLKVWDLPVWFTYVHNTYGRQTEAGKMQHVREPVTRGSNLRRGKRWPGYGKTPKHRWCAWLMSWKGIKVQAVYRLICACIKRKITEFWACATFTAPMRGRASVSWTQVTFRCFPWRNLNFTRRCFYHARELREFINWIHAVLIIFVECHTFRFLHQSLSAEQVGSVQLHAKV